MKDSLVLITGGVSGLGLEIVKALKKKCINTKIYATCSKKIISYDLIDLSFYEAIYENIDLRDKSGIDTLLEKTKHLQFDLIIFNHNVSVYKNLEKKPVNEITEEIMANLIAPCLILKNHIKLNQKQKILFILSHICFMYNPGFSIYRASKSFLDSLSKNLTFEYPQSIFIRAYPGAIDTNFQKNNQYTGLSLFKKNQPEVIANKILLALSNKRDFIAPRDRLIRFIDAILPFWVIHFLYKFLIK